MAQSSVYGGDEINAIVIDTGSYCTRIGFAGEDAPKVVIPTSIGRRKNPNFDPELLPTEDGKEGQKEGRESRTSPHQEYLYYFDDDAQIPREGTEFINPLTDGVVTDWDALIALWDHGLKDRLRVDVTEHPLLVTEQAWNSDENRTRVMEIAFTYYNVPAFYIVKTPVCAILASPKGGSGLVVDIGHQVVTATPIIDGMVLFKPSRRSRIGGKFLNAQVRKMFDNEKLEVVPRYLVAGKKPVETGQEPEYKKKQLNFEVSDSYHELQLEHIYHEFKESMCEVTDAALPPELQLKDRDHRIFELPTGFSKSFGRQRLETAESLLKPQDYQIKGFEAADDAEPKPSTEEKDPLVVTDRSTTGFKYMGVSQLVLDCVNACDVDIRANLANNLVVTGGTSLIEGLNKRIVEELTTEMAGVKIRLHSPGSAIERTYASWIGGSVLASLGTFHQLWISKREYQEVGAAKLLEKRFR